METHRDEPRIFISHSSQDKHFVERLAWDLRRFGFDVWYDEWEIAVGDSIVDKVFAGLDASDTLIVVLSPVSIDSRWVKEELSTAVMRRISENDIRILPVLIESCELPMTLRHIRYADFWEHHDEAMSHLLDSLAPGHLMWQALEHLYDHLCMICDQLSETDLNAEAGDKVLKIHSLLEAALNLRTEIEFRRARQKMRDLNFFEKIGVLVEKGVDVRSQSWNALVQFHAGVTHAMRSHQVHLHMLAEMLRERYESDSLRESFIRGLERFKHIMRTLCFDNWNRESKEAGLTDEGT